MASYYKLYVLYDISLAQKKHQVLERSGLSSNDLAQIWSLSDVPRWEDGRIQCFPLAIPGGKS